MPKPKVPASPLPPTTAQAAPSMISTAPVADPNILTSPQGLPKNGRPTLRTLLGGLQ